MPGIAVARGPSHRRLTAAAHPDGRMRRPRWPRSGIHFPKGHVSSLIGNDIVGPAFLDDLEILVGDCAALLKLYSQGLELLFGPAHTDPQNEAAAAWLIDVGRHSRRQQRMTVGKNDDRGAKLEILSDAREPGERDEWIVERRRILPVDVGSNGDVIGNHNEVVAERF